MTGKINRVVKELINLFSSAIVTDMMLHLIVGAVKTNSMIYNVYYNPNITVIVHIL